MAKKQRSSIKGLSTEAEMMSNSICCTTSRVPVAAAIAHQQRSVSKLKEWWASSQMRLSTVPTDSSNPPEPILLACHRLYATSLSPVRGHRRFRTFSTTLSSERCIMATTTDENECRRTLWIKSDNDGNTNIEPNKLSISEWKFVHALSNAEVAAKSCFDRNWGRWIRLFRHSFCKSQHSTFSTSSFASLEFKDSVQIH